MLRGSIPPSRYGGRERLQNFGSFALTSNTRLQVCSRRRCRGHVCSRPSASHAVRRRRRSSERRPNGACIWRCYDPSRSPRCERPHENNDSYEWSPNNATKPSNALLFMRGGSARAGCRSSARRRQRMRPDGASRKCWPDHTNRVEDIASRIEPATDRPVGGTVHSAGRVTFDDLRVGQQHFSPVTKPNHEDHGLSPGSGSKKGGLAA